MGDLKKDAYLRAKEKAERFLSEEGEYRLGYIEAEKPHPKTRRLSQTFLENVSDGVRLLAEVDSEMSLRAKEALASEEYVLFADSVRKTLGRGHKVIFSGCGSSGRLSMQLERSFRAAAEKLIAAYPDIRKEICELRDRVGVIMTGGDYAVIRAAESFEDSTKLGREMAREKGIGEGDLLVGVTATGETTSVIGTAEQALDNGARVYMLICSPPDEMINRLSRVRKVYGHKNCSVLVMPSGPMALTGSTRMQSSTIEQLAGGVALEGAIYDLLEKHGKNAVFPGYAAYGRAFEDTASSLLNERAVRLMTRLIENERDVYKNGGVVTLFSDDCILDVLTDTTERSPTFKTPPFRPEGDKTGETSWAFFKHTSLDTPSAWRKCFLRELNCIEWDRGKYRSLGLSDEQIDAIPDIGAKALRSFRIGCERDEEREGEGNLAEWVGVFSPDESFYKASRGYGIRVSLSLEEAGVECMPTYMDIFEHLGLKMALNDVSTGTMACMGRIDGNWMTSLSLSNKKLTDRGARIVSDLCAVPYEKALFEVLYSLELIKEKNGSGSPVHETVVRLGMK